MTDAIDLAAPATRKSTLDIKFISHGTLESKDRDATRKFYEEFFGFEVIRSSPMSLMVRVGKGPHIYVVVPKINDAPAMPVTNHNGLDVHSDAEVDRAYSMVKRDAAKWGLHKISRPMVQHGTYSFYFWDLDDNSWEILSNPPGGYSWMFERGDQEGQGTFAKDFVRPASLTEAGAKA